MTEVNNNYNSYKVAGSALFGGGLGAAIGAAKAPSILGKINPDKFIQDSVYNAAIKDRFIKSGVNVNETADSIFNACSGCIDSSKNVIKKILPDNLKEMTIKTFKEKIKNNLEPQDEQWAESVFEKVSTFTDDVLLKKENITEYITSSNPQYGKVKEGLNNFVSRLPKQTGKYALIGAGIGACVFGLFKAFRLGKKADN